MAIERNERTRLAMIDAFSSRENSYQLPLDPITVGSIMGMITFRRRIADGTASPSEVAAFERLSTDRQTAMDTALVARAVDELIASRDQKLLLASMWSSLYQIAEGVHAKGFSGKDFQDDTALLSAAALRGRCFQTTIGSTSTRRSTCARSSSTTSTPCRSSTRRSPSVTPGATTCRRGSSCSGSMSPVRSWSAPTARKCGAARAFSTCRLTGAGAVSSPATVSTSTSPGECGHYGPAIAQEIVRYADLAGGDKITCAGTIDAYVRGEG